MKKLIHNFIQAEGEQKELYMQVFVFLYLKTGLQNQGINHLKHLYQYIIRKKSIGKDEEEFLVQSFIQAKEEQALKPFLDFF